MPFEDCATCATIDAVMGAVAGADIALAWLAGCAIKALGSPKASVANTARSVIEQSLVLEGTRYTGINDVSK